MLTSRSVTNARLSSSSFRRLSLLASLTVIGASVLVSAPDARADASGYQPAGSFSLPGPSGLFDVPPDGRVVALVGSTVYRETAAGSRTFSSLGTLPTGGDIPSFGAAFLRVSPNGTRIAVGNNGGSTFDNYRVGVFAISGLGGTWFSAGHFDAAWIDNRYIALTAGTFGSPGVVTALDTTSASPTSPSNVTLVVNVGGASGGVAFDAAGNLYTANGFQASGPSGTGAIYAFHKTAWSAALAGGAPVNFETQGIPIVDLLSGSPIGFDGAGDLLVGGGNSFASVPDDNYFAIVSASAVSAALAGGGLISTADPSKVRKLDPDPGAASFYTVTANTSRNELYAVNAGSATAFIYAYAPAVPAVPAWGLFLIASLLLIAGSRYVRASA